MNPATLETKPRVGAGFRLQWEPMQDCHVLLYPEGMVKLNGSAGEIMKRCDGQRTLAEIGSCQRVLVGLLPARPTLSTLITARTS